MGIKRRNKNRGYQQLRVWEDAIRLYAETCRLLGGWPFEMKRIASQAMASADSVHRNIAEGYCRRSIREYIHYLYIALGSLGESVSGYHAYSNADQLSEEAFETLDQIAFKLENGLLRLVEALERKQDAGEWTDRLIVQEFNAIYLGTNPNTPTPQHPVIPPLPRPSPCSTSSGSPYSLPASWLRYSPENLMPLGKGD